MKYSELPKWIQNLIKIRHGEQRDSSRFNPSDSISSLFTWDKTAEGQEFWERMAYSSGKIPDPSTYVKVGDWIQITKSDIHWDKGMDKYVGKTVQVIPHPKPGCIFAVSFNENCSDFYWQLESGHFVKAHPPANQSTKIPTPISPTEVSKELKVGDKVRVTKAGFAERGFDFRREREGQVGILREDDSTSLPYRVEWDDGDKNWFRKDQIELVPKHPTTQFAETTIQLIQQSSFKSTNNDIFRKTYPISRGEECQENHICSKPKFTPIAGRY